MMTIQQPAILGSRMYWPTPVSLFGSCRGIFNIAPGYGLERMIDDVPTTFYASQGGLIAGYAHAGINLGVRRELSLVEIMPNEGAVIFVGTVEGSNDMFTWTTLATIGAGALSSGFNSISVSGAYQFVRLRSSTADRLDIKELRVTGIETGSVVVQANLLTATYTAIDAGFSGFPVSNISDDLVATRYATATPYAPEVAWIKADLGQVRYVHTVGFHFSFPSRQFYKVQVSNDNVNWTTVYTMPAQATNQTHQYLPIQTTARYLRFLNQNNEYLEIYDIMIYGN